MPRAADKGRRLSDKHAPAHNGPAPPQQGHTLPDWLPPLLAAPFAGSVAGVLIRRLPAGRPVMWARSACETCGHTLRWTDLVPLLSHLLLRGRCRTCHAPIPPFHWHVELAALLVAAWVVAAHGAPTWFAAHGAPSWVAAPDFPAAADFPAYPAQLWADCTLGWLLLALAWIDWRHHRLPDALTLPLMALGLAAAAWLDPASLLDHAVGAIAGFALFWLVRVAYRALRGRDGLGLGDAKLLAAAGAWVGWQGLDRVVLLGALASIGIALIRRQTLAATLAVPFGPGLALATLAVRLHL